MCTLLLFASGSLCLQRSRHVMAMESLIEAAEVERIMRALLKCASSAVDEALLLYVWYSTLSLYVCTSSSLAWRPSRRRQSQIPFFASLPPPLPTSRVLGPSGGATNACARCELGGRLGSMLVRAAEAQLTRSPSSFSSIMTILRRGYSE